MRVVRALIGVLFIVAGAAGIGGFDFSDAWPWVLAAVALASGLLGLTRVVVDSR